VADALGKLVLTSSGEAALATADLVVEAITENLPLKQEHIDRTLHIQNLEQYEIGSLS
jgi:3-hydroxyacyl-CoA dehydrogenase